MSVINVAHLIAGLSRGGAEVMLYNLVQSLPREAGFAHSIISLTDECKFDFSALGASVRSLGLKRGVPSAKALWRLRGMLTSMRPSLVHGWMYHGNIAAVLSSRRAVPVVWGVHHALHDLANEKALTRVLVRSGPLLSRRATQIIYCSEKSLQQHEDIGYPAIRSRFIPNGFDCERFRPDVNARKALRAELDLPDDSLLVGHAARFHPIKNHVGLVRAFAATAYAHPKAYLLLAGGGVTSENKALVAAVHECGLDGRVLLLGERNDAPRFFAGLDVHVLSSRSEGFPNVLGEAMACGVPCVSTDVGDAANIIADTGRVVPAGSESELTSGLNEVLALPFEERRALGLRARERVLREFSLSVVAAKYATAYRSALAETKK